MHKALDCLPSVFESEPLINQGLIMVKPHALRGGLDYIVESILRKDGACHVDGLTDPALQDTLKRINVRSVIPRDLRTIKHGRELINLFYGDKANRRYFPLILEWYMGKVVFLDFTLRSKVPEGVLSDLDILKGTTRTYRSNGEVVDIDTGIRGVLGTAYVACDRESLDSMDDVVYRDAIEPVIQNYIHVCDRPSEAERAIELIS